ncbi:MAG: hypothetical protein KKA60_06460, partial [Proteobacteria bacterium]|nr:hypothetical protein [Pseudomonadota bacterium]
AADEYAADVPRCIRPDLAAQYSSMPMSGGWEAFNNLLSDATGTALSGEAAAAVNPFAMIGDFMNDATGGMAGVSYDLSGLNTTVTRNQSNFSDYQSLAGMGGVDALAKILPTFNTHSEGVVNFMASPTIGNRQTGEFVGDFSGSLGVNISATVSLKP